PRARCTTISNRANSRARRPPASASSTRTSTVRCSTRIRVTRADSTCWSARTTTSTSRRRAATKTAWPSRWRGCATTIGTEAMKLFYGWIIVGVGIVVTCVGFGAMASLTVFLQPMSEAMGWSRTGISTAALINWLCMGVGALVWGALSDRFGTRAVVLSGGVLLGLGLVTASQAASLGQFQLVFGMIVGLAAGSFYTPVTATTSRWFTRNRSLAVALVSAGLSAGSAIMAPLARWLITSYDWRTAMLVIGDVVWLVIVPTALLVRNAPVAPPVAGAAAAATGPD